MTNPYLASIIGSRAARFFRRYVWAWRRLWLRTLSASLLVALVVYVSTPREYEAELLTLAEATVVEINDTENADAMTLGIGRRVRDDILPSYYRLLFRSRPFLMSVLQSPVVRQDAPGDTLTLYDYIREDIRYPWWSYLRMGVRMVTALPGQLLRMLSGGSSAASDSLRMASVPDLHRYDATYTGISQLTRRENTATGVLWSRIGFEIDADKRGVLFRLRMQDPQVAAIAVDSLMRRVQDKVNESRLAKIRANLAYLEAAKQEAAEAYREAQEEYAAFADRNRDLSRLDARRRLANLNTRKQLAYRAYTQRSMQVEKAKENLVRRKPILTVIQPAEVPRRAVVLWQPFVAWPLLAIAGTLGWIYMKERRFKLRLKKWKRPTIRRPRWFTR